MEGSRLTPVRIVGALFTGALAFLLLRAPLGVAMAALAGAGLAVAAVRWFPRAVLLRVIWTVPLFALLIFTAIQMMFHVPGSPFASEKNTSAQIIEEQNKKYGLVEKSFAGGCAFFASYMKNVVVDGYMGPSIKSQGRSVTDVLLPALPVSVTLGLMALLLATAIGLVLGMRAGLHPNTWVDYSGMGVSMIGISLPSFVIGAILILLFSIGKPFGFFPVAGWGGYRHLFLPSIALALPTAAYIARLARAGTLEVMTEDFVRTARAKGLPERAVVLKHAFKGAILPVVSFLGPAAAGIMTGSFVVETMFGIPGIGRYFVNGAINRDYYVVLGTVFVECGIVIAFNLIVDMAYAWLDPRVRTKT